MSKFKLAYSIPAPIEVEFYYTYSLVRQINEDNENPEYETLMEIDHHNDENYNNQNHDLTSSDIKTFIDLAIPQEDLDKVIEANNENGEIIINKIKNIKDEIIQEYTNIIASRDPNDSYSSLYEKNKIKISNIMNYAIHPDELIDNTESHSQYFPVNTTLKVVKSTRNTNPKGDNLINHYYEEVYLYNFKIARVIKRNNNNTWKEICDQIKYGFPYSDYVNAEPYIVNNETSIPYLIGLSSTSGLLYRTNSYGDDESTMKEEFESSISYGSLNLKQKWSLQLDDEDRLENCYFLLMPINRSTVFHHLNSFFFSGKRDMYIHRDVLNDFANQKFINSLFINLI